MATRRRNSKRYTTRKRGGIINPHHTAGIPRLDVYMANRTAVRDIRITRLRTLMSEIESNTTYTRGIDQLRDDIQRLQHEPEFDEWYDSIVERLAHIKFRQICIAANLDYDDESDATTRAFNLALRYVDAIVHRAEPVATVNREIDALYHATTKRARRE